MSYGGEIFEISHFNNLCNTWGQNIINASKDKCWISCCGRVFKFIREHFSPCTATNVMTGRKGIYALMTMDSHKKKRLFLVNSLSEKVDISLKEFDFKTAYMLSGKGRMYYEKENESCVNEKTFEIRTDEINLEGLSLCCLE